MGYTFQGRIYVFEWVSHGTYGPILAQRYSNEAPYVIDQPESRIESEHNKHRREIEKVLEANPD